MEDYILYGGKKITLDEYLRILGPEPEKPVVKLADKNPGDLVQIGKFEMIVLEQKEHECFLLLKDRCLEPVIFGRTNDYCVSEPKKVCDQFFEELKRYVSEDNIIEHMVNVTALTGATDYGVEGYILAKASLLSLDMCQKYIDILDRHMLEEWWWLTTAGDTHRHKNITTVLSVSPRGDIYTGDSSTEFASVRPFCVLHSDLILAA